MSKSEQTFPNLLECLVCPKLDACLAKCLAVIAAADEHVRTEERARTERHIEASRPLN